MAETAMRFEGHENRECGDHRTVGYRAWCFTCTEWCYPDIPCKGCELPTLRAAVQSLLTAQGRMLDDWAEANEERRRELWRRLHEEADTVRALLVANAPLSPAEPVPPAPADAEVPGGATEPETSGE